jgi:hypothetical protein
MSENSIGNIKNFDVNAMMKYLIAGFWSFFVFYSIVGNKSHLTAKIGLDSVFICFSFGALTYHCFRSTLFPFLTRLGDLLFKNVRLQKALDENGNRFFKARWIVLTKWSKLNDNYIIQRTKPEFKDLDSREYSLWLSSVIMQYLCGAFTLLITSYFYQNNGVPAFGKSIYIFSGVILIVSGFISQRCLEARLLRHKIELELGLKSKNA